jgi:hypothetical protein
VPEPRDVYNGRRRDDVPDISVVNSIKRQVHSSACL